MIGCKFLAQKLINFQFCSTTTGYAVVNDFIVFNNGSIPAKNPNYQIVMFQMVTDLISYIISRLACTLSVVKKYSYFSYDSSFTVLL